MAEGEAGFEPSPRNSAWWKVIRRTAQPPLIAFERPKQRVRRLRRELLSGCGTKLLLPVSGLQHELSRYLATLPPLTANRVLVKPFHWNEPLK
jgi:hypothetical protein